MIYAPFAWWDGTGLAHDLLLWPMAMAPDDTSWVADAPSWAIAAARIALGAAMVWLALQWSTGREARTLAMLAILAAAAAPQFHNNYVPWFSVWMVLATAEAFAGPAQPASASAARLARLRAWGSRWRLRMRMDLGVTSTSSSSSI
jgi:hypothetical protein